MFERTLLRIISIILSLLCTVAVLESGERDAGPNRLSGLHSDVARLEKKIHNMINKERRKKGLAVLSWDEKLHDIAHKYSQDMTQRNFFSHTDPDGKTFCDRYKAARYECKIKAGGTTCLGAENISQDNLDDSLIHRDGRIFIDDDMEDKIAESVVKRWMGSKGHRDNILAPYFKRQGVGVALSGDGKVYITENFC